MRILIATWSRNLVGGTEKYLKALLPGLANRGHQVGLVYEHQANLTREVIDSTGQSGDSWRLADLGLESLMRSVANWAPDVVYSHGLEDSDLEDALLEAYPTVLFAHGYYGTCATGSKCHAFPLAQPCDRRFGAACLLLHYPRRCGGLNPWSAWRSFRRQAERHARLGDYRAILVASAHMRREFLRNGVNPERLHVVPYPSPDGDTHSAPPEQKIPRGRILLIGRLTALKGGHYLIPAIAKASAKLGQTLTLTIAGDGPERQRLEELAGKFRVPAEFAGWVNTLQVGELMRATDVLAVPSLWPEPFGLVGIEAARFCVPAAGYGVGGIPDWLIPGQTGELAPGDPPTVDGLADAIVRVIGDPERYSTLCRGAWRHYCTFTLEAHLQKLELILSAAQNGASHPSPGLAATLNR